MFRSEFRHHNRIILTLISLVSLIMLRKVVGNGTSNKMEKERVPAGVKEVDGYVLSPVSSLYVADIGEFATAHKQWQSTFAVVEQHERLASGQGVRFAVETLSAPDPDHLKKPTVGREEFLSNLKEGAASSVYSRGSEDRHDETTQNIRLEAVSECPDNLVFVGGQGFFAACLSAFAQHLPLAISPDHIWALVSYAFSKHVDNHSEELRANFVKHDGKKRLEVRADHLVMSGGGGPDSGSLAEVWEQTIFPDFSDQIRGHIGDKAHSSIATGFSTSTAASQAAHEITLMSAMKHYFSYGMSTMCGIPNVTLLGSEEDWVALRARAETLGGLMTPKFSSTWMPVLLPVLDEFVSSYRGQVNHGFWQSMVKLRHRGGSGACSKVSGWLQILFPYLKGGELNRDLRPWQEMYFTSSGPDPEDIPSILSAAPVDWDYNGITYDLHFCAGFTGCTQDPSDGTLTPSMGWYVTHDPPSNPKERLQVITAEIGDLIKGHAKEAQGDVLDKTQPWFVRVSLLYLEQKSIFESLLKQLKSDEERIAKEKTYTSWFSETQKQNLEKEIKRFEVEKAEYDAAPKFTSPDGMVRAMFAEEI